MYYYAKCQDRKSSDFGRHSNASDFYSSIKEP